MTRPLGGVLWPRPYDSTSGSSSGGGSGLGPDIVAPPAPSAFTARNVSTATLTQEGDELYALATTAVGVHQSWFKAKATTLLKVTLAWFPWQSNGGNSAQGIMLRDSVTGLMANYGIGSVNGTRGWYASRVPTGGGWTSDYYNTGIIDFYPRGGPVWLQVEDDGTNRICRFSNDQGRHWRQLHSVARTDHALMDEVGFGLLTNGQAWTHAMTIFHFEEG
jgi:hypothetical protein